MVIQNIAVFLITTLLSLYISAVLIRFLLALARADFYNPLSQFLVTVTNPLLKPLRRFIPALGKIDTSSLVLAWVLKFLGGLLLMSLQGSQADVLTIVVASFFDVLRSIIWIYIIALIINAVMSWIGNSHGNPAASLLESLTAPILRPIRKIVPHIGMIDLSPLAAILGLQILLIVLNPFPAIF